MDGGFGANNPSHEVSSELSTIHPTSPTCLVSIGSGKRHPISRFKPRLLGRLFTYIQAAIKLVTDTEKVHDMMEEMAARSKNFSYFRFDVPGLEDVVMDEWVMRKRKQLPEGNKMSTIEFIERQTHAYLSQTETEKSIRACAQKVVDSYRLITEVSPVLREVSVRNLSHVPRRNTRFHGREEMLRNMYEYLNPQAVLDSSGIRSCILYGLGGIGKTQIAIEYIYRHMNDYEYIFWVQAWDAPQLDRHYSSIAPRAGRGGVDAIQNLHQVVQIAQTWLSTTSQSRRTISYIKTCRRRLTEFARCYLVACFR